MIGQLCPSFVRQKSRLPPTYIVFGSCGEIMIGKVHWNRYLMSSDEISIGCRATDSRAEEPVRCPCA